MNTINLRVVAKNLLILIGLFFSLSPLVLAQTDASAFTHAKRYNKVGQITGEIMPDPDGTGSLKFLATRNTYNIHGLLESTEQGYLRAWQAHTIKPKNWTGFVVHKAEYFEYDDWGRLLQAEVADGSGQLYGITQNSYDSQGRLECSAKRMNPDIYHALPNNACTLGAEGDSGPDRITKYHYDDKFRVSKIQKALNTPLEQNYAEYTYTVLWQKDSVTDANGNKSEFRYDEHGRLEYWLFPSKDALGAVNEEDYERYGYDKNGNRTELRKRDGRIIGYSFDNLNRMTHKDIPGGTTQDVSYSYDNRGLQTSAEFPNGRGITNAYTGFGELESETSNVNGTSYLLKYQYDQNGNQTRVTFPDNNYFTYGYDGVDRIDHIKQSGSTTLVSHSYDNYGRAHSRSARGNVVSTLGYDDISRVDEIDLNFAGDANDVNIGLTYNPANQITSQLLSSNSFDYTGVGGIKGTYEPNNLNQYATVGGVTFEYDDNGNLEDTGSFGYDYGYDVENRLVSVSGLDNATLKYDPMGRLYEYSVNGDTTYFLYNGDSLVAEYKNGQMVKRYVHGVGTDVPLVAYAGSNLNDSNRTFLHRNHQGSVIAVTSDSGSLTQVNTYDEYGVPANTNSGRFAYTGQVALNEIGLYHYRARAYHPELGRFLQTDPVGYEDDVNLYAYVGNDPHNYTDPTGKVRKPRVANKAEQAGYTILAGMLLKAVSEPGSSLHDLGTSMVEQGQRMTPGRGKAPGTGRKGASGELTTTSGNTFTGNSTRSSRTGGDPREPMNDQVSNALDNVKNPSGTHGACCEIDAMNKAANAGDTLQGASMGPVRDNKTGEVKPPCSTCREVMDQLEVDY